MPFAASDRNCSFAAKTRKLSYATNFTKPHGIQQNRMAGYPKIMCHFHGRLYSLFRPVQCISRGKVESGIQSLGQHLRFISPALRAPVRHDNGNASAARKNVIRKILQKKAAPDSRSFRRMVCTLQSFSLGYRPAGHVAHRHFGRFCIRSFKNGK